MLTFVVQHYSKRWGPLLELLGPILAFSGFLLILASGLNDLSKTNESNESTRTIESRTASTPVAGDGK